MRLDSTPEHYVSLRPTGDSVTRSVAPHLFPSRRDFLGATVPRLLRIGFILSCLVPSSEFLRRPSWSPLSEQPVLPGFRPSPRHHRRCPLIAGALLLPLRSVLRFSQPLDGFRHLRLCALIASRSHAQGSAVQGFLPARSRARLVVGPCPHAVAVRALTGKPAATHERFDFEALLRGSTRSSRKVISLPRGRSPLRFLPPSGFVSLAVGPVPRVLRS